jgi:hypothetical protein
MIYTGLSCSFLTSAAITGAQIGEMSKLGCLIEWSIRDMWADSLYFLYVAFGSIWKPFSSYYLLRNHVGLIFFYFSSRPCVRLYLCSLMHTGRCIMSRNTIIVLIYHRHKTFSNLEKKRKFSWWNWDNNFTKIMLLRPDSVVITFISRTLKISV